MCEQTTELLLLFKKSHLNIDLLMSLHAVNQDVSHALGGQTASECSGPQDGQRPAAGKRQVTQQQQNTFGKHFSASNLVKDGTFTVDAESCKTFLQS